MRVLVAPGAFKGCLTARAVADAVARGIEDAGADAVRLPVADGGDGTVDAVLAAGAAARSVPVRDALGRRHEGRLAVRGRTVVVETAGTCGLAMLAPDELDPLAASSAGLGDAVRAALALRPERLVIGLGGSASTDGGLGMLAALGAVLLDARGRRLEGCGADLAELAAVDLDALADLRGIDLVCATDVDSPLTGPAGAAHVFGGQKGADARERALLDDGLRRLVRVLDDPTGGRVGAWAAEPGAGAAGGIGLAVRLLGGRRVSGADLVLDLVGFDRAAITCEAVVTGEGRLDEQSLAGKLPVVVARRAAPLPTVAVAGASTLPATRAGELFASVETLAERTEVDTVHDRALTALLLRRVGHDVVERLRSRSRLTPLPRPPTRPV